MSLAHLMIHLLNEDLGAVLSRLNRGHNNVEDVDEQTVPDPDFGDDHEKQKRFELRFPFCATHNVRHNVDLELFESQERQRRELIDRYEKSKTDPPSRPNNLDDEEENLCIACCERPREVAFKECGHRVVCLRCFEKLDQCPLCRLDL